MDSLLGSYVWEFLRRGFRLESVAWKILVGSCYLGSSARVLSHRNFRFKALFSDRWLGNIRSGPLIVNIRLEAFAWVFLLVNLGWLFSF